MAETAASLFFQLSAPVAVEQRPDGLTLRGREGEIHLTKGAVDPPAGWFEAAEAGVSARQQSSGSWRLASTDKPASHASDAGAMLASAAVEFVWEVPAAALRWHRPLPLLLEPLGQPFRGSPAQRLLGRALVRLLGVPGVVPLLIGWHGRRTRQRTR